MLASIIETITDRGLGLPQGQAQPIAVAGCCSSGALDTPPHVLTPDQLTIVSMLVGVAAGG